MISKIYNLDDYRQIFALSEPDLQKKILEYPAGISSVNAELYALGHLIISGDPAYSLSPKEMRDYASKILRENIAATDKSCQSALIAQWEQSLELFLSDYETGKKQGRYRAMDLPPFSNVEETYELLLCTDFLFNPPVSSGTAQELMNELCKLAAEVRIFPLPQDKNAVAAELGPMMLALQQRNFGVEIRAVNYPPCNQASAMLRIWAKECEVNQQISMA
jgi:hypothetical protein